MWKNKVIYWSAKTIKLVFIAIVLTFLLFWFLFSVLPNIIGHLKYDKGFDTSFVLGYVFSPDNAKLAYFEANVSGKYIYTPNFFGDSVVQTIKKTSRDLVIFDLEKNVVGKRFSLSGKDASLFKEGWRLRWSGDKVQICQHTKYAFLVDTGYGNTETIESAYESCGRMWGGSISDYKDVYDGKNGLFSSDGKYFVYIEDDPLFFTTIRNCAWESGGSLGCVSGDTQSKLKRNTINVIKIEK